MTVADSPPEPRSWRARNATTPSATPSRSSSLFQRGVGIRPVVEKRATDAIAASRMSSRSSSSTTARRTGRRGGPRDRRQGGPAPPEPGIRRGAEDRHPPRLFGGSRSSTPTGDTRPRRSPTRRLLRCRMLLAPAPAERRDPLIRRPAKKALTILASYLTGSKSPISTPGFGCSPGLAIEFFDRLPSKFSFTTTITLAALNSGYLVEYVEVDYYSRTGKSKIRPIQDTSAHDVDPAVTLIVRPSRSTARCAILVLLERHLRLGWFVFGKSSTTRRCCSCSRRSNASPSDACRRGERPAEPPHQTILRHGRVRSFPSFRPK